MMHIAKNPLNRRTFLRGAGVALALPFLDAMSPVFGRAAKAAASESVVPRRMVCIQTNQGIMPQFFFPETAGRDFAGMGTVGNWRWIDRHTTAKARKIRMDIRVPNFCNDWGRAAPESCAPAAMAQCESLLMGRTFA